VVEGARLESVYTGNCIEGSNPSLSAIKNQKLETVGLGRRGSIPFAPSWVDHIDSGSEKLKPC
jgi:hypothetical protein